MLIARDTRGAAPPSILVVEDERVVAPDNTVLVAGRLLQIERQPGRLHCAINPGAQLGQWQALERLEGLADLTGQQCRTQIAEHRPHILQALENAVRRLIKNQGSRLFLHLLQARPPSGSPDTAPTEALRAEG